MLVDDVPVEPLPIEPPDVLPIDPVDPPLVEPLPIDPVEDDPDDEPRWLRDDFFDVEDVPLMPPPEVDDIEPVPPLVPIDPLPVEPPLIEPLPIEPPVDPIEPEFIEPDAPPELVAPAPVAPAEPDPPAAPDAPAPPPAAPPAPPADCAITATGARATAADMIMILRIFLSCYHVRAQPLVTPIVPAHGAEPGWLGRLLDASRSAIALDIRRAWLAVAGAERGAMSITLTRPFRMESSPRVFVRRVPRRATGPRGSSAKDLRINRMAGNDC